jgi:hypothetical protein
VTAALQEVRGDKPGPGTEKPAAGSRPDPAAREAQLAAPLAKALDVSEAKVKAALAEIRDAAEADRSAAFEKKLDAAVKAGTLTQSEADAVTKAAKLRVINVGPR